MKANLILLFFFLFVIVLRASDKKDIIDLSRNSCVEVYSISGNSKGTGFFIAEDLIATCFHVVGYVKNDKKKIILHVFPDITVKTITGEKITAQCIAPFQTQTDISPLVYDFAILKLSKKPKNIKGYILKPFDGNLDSLNIGSKCYYTGYPLEAPTMITNQGYISGIAKNVNIICIQGSINKGNSGSALLSKSGEILGIISMREGGISKGLEELMQYIEKTSKQGSVQLMGVDPLQAIKATIETLDTYISTGIGYARNIIFLLEYCKKYKIKIGS